MSIDESKETLNEADTASEETSSPEVQEEVEDSDQSQDAPQEQESAQQPTVEEKKPTRAERRVQQLLEKMKAQKQAADMPRADYGQQPTDALITPEDYESGIDPKVLEQRMQAREQRNLQANTQTIKQQLKAEFAYEQATKEHEADLESVSQSEDIKKNPVLERMAVRLYEKENYLVDPRTGRTYFNPVIKLSEALKIVKADIAEATGTALADVQVKANENRETGALSPSQGTTSSDDDYTQAFETAKEKGDDRSWAEVLKKRGLINVS